MAMHERKRFGVGGAELELQRDIIHRQRQLDLIEQGVNALARHRRGDDADRRIL